MVVHRLQARDSRKLAEAHSGDMHGGMLAQPHNCYRASLKDHTEDSGLQPRPLVLVQL